MSKKIAINGFGRIGRLFLRNLIENNFYNNEVDIIAINDLSDAENLAYLLKYDSIHGAIRDIPIFAKDFETLIVGERIIKVLNLKNNPNELPWNEFGIDLVIESTGSFTSYNEAKGHIDSGAKKVILSAPGDDEIPTYLIGVNDNSYRNELVISNASCTTNCLAPIVQVIQQEGIGIQEGFMTTAHAYTASQTLVDGKSKKSFRDGRAGAINIIPATTGAVKSITRIFPELKGKITGMSLRVPVPNVSLVDFTFRSLKSTSLEEINSLMKKASETYLNGILDYTEEDVVSSDFVHNSFSSTYDSKASMELNSNFFKLIAWYDNEWAYSCRLCELTRRVLRTI